MYIELLTREILNIVEYENVIIIGRNMHAYKYIIVGLSSLIEDVFIPG